MDEIWKPVQGFDGKYDVSNLGRVRTVPRRVFYYNTKDKLKNIYERILTPCDNGRGYKYFGVRSSKTYCKHIYIHKAVALAFLENPDNHTDVNHIDCNKANNQVENLEWCSKSHNIRHAFANGLMNTRKGEDVPHSKLKSQDVLEIRRLALNKLMFHKDIAKKFGISEGYISNIAAGRKWKHLK